MVMMQIPTPLKAQFRVEPPGWWTGMHDPALQLLVFGKDAGAWQVSLDHPGVRLVRTHRAESPSYLFLDLEISPNAAPGVVELVFTHPGLPDQTVQYPLEARHRPASDFRGFGPADAVYLIDPNMLEVSYLEGYRVDPLAKNGLSDRRLMSVDWSLVCKNWDGLGAVFDIDPTAAMTF